MNKQHKTGHKSDNKLVVARRKGGGEMGKIGEED